MNRLTAGLLAEMLADVVDETERLSNSNAAFHEEAHFQAGLFAKLRQAMPELFPIAEATYFDEHWRERCDICLLKSTSPVGWIELKKAYLGRGVGWDAKPAEQLHGLLWDVAKVACQMRVEARLDSYGYLAAFFYNQREFPFAPGVVEGCMLDRGKCLERLCDWFKDRGEPARRKAWEALGLSENMAAKDLRSQYVRCLRLVVADVEDLQVRTPRRSPVDVRNPGKETANGKLEYQVVATRMHK